MGQEIRQDAPEAGKSCRCRQILHAAQLRPVQEWWGRETWHGPFQGHPEVSLSILLALGIPVILCILVALCIPEILHIPVSLRIPASLCILVALGALMALGIPASLCILVALASCWPCASQQPWTPWWLCAHSAPGGLA